jgi:hypothetical protein
MEVINLPEAKGMPSRPSSPGTSVSAGDQARRPTHLAAKGTAFPAGGRDGNPEEYARLKMEAYLTGVAARGEELLQPDTQSTRAAAIFSSLKLPADFPGLDDGGYGPLECSLAAGPSHLVAVTTPAWAVLDKAGNQLLRSDFGDWFSAVPGVGGGLHVFNPKVIYDQYKGRWVLAAFGWRAAENQGGGQAGKGQSLFLLSVSQTRSPLGGWWSWALDASLNGQQETKFHAASLGLGVDSGALYLTANMFDARGEFQYAKLRVIDKAPLVAGGQLTWWDYWDLRNADGTPAFGVRPAHTFGNPGVQYLLNAARDGQGLTQWSLTNPLGRPPQLSRRTVSTPAYHIPPDARQPGTGRELDTGDARITNAVFRNGALWAAHTVAANWGEAENRAAIQWFQINPGAGVLVQQGIFGAPGYDYFCPTVMADGQSNLVMVFNRVGADEYPAVRFTGRLSTDPLNRLHGSALLKQSNAPGPRAWGAYNGAAVDPNDVKVWIIGKYAAGESEGATWIGETSYLTDSPEAHRHTARRMVLV